MSVNTTPPGLRHGTATELRVDLAGALSPEMVAAVAEACARAERSAGCELLVLWLDGPADPARPWPGDAPVHLVSRWEKALRRLERLDLLTVGVCAGRASQAALEVLLATDHRIVGTDTAIRLGGGPSGVWPGMALHRLVQQSGLAAARRLVLRPELYAADLREAGVADEVAADPRAALAQALDRFAGLAGSEAAIRRRLLLDAVVVGYEEALGAHLAACDRTVRRAAERA